MSTKEKLAKALEAASAPAEMIAKARAGYYDDWDSDLDAPIMTLVEDATKAGLQDIAQRAMSGEFDGTEEEMNAWFEREGKDLLKGD
jgi:hypothetical protein